MEARKCCYFLKSYKSSKVSATYDHASANALTELRTAPPNSLVFPKLLESLELLEHSSICWPPSWCKI